ncbi:putative proteasome endopeptidase complex [Helianthus debilis subsp. tardiflorus]
MAEDASFEDDQLAAMTTEDIQRASRLLDNEIRILKEELQRTNLELDSFKDKIKENQEKIKLNKQLPYLVGNIVEVISIHPLNLEMNILIPFQMVIIANVYSFMPYK